MPSVDRKQFNQVLQNTKLDVRTAEANPALKAALPAEADLNHDGTIAGATEVNALFTQIDSFGRNPNSAQTALVGPDGTATQAARAMRALGEMTQNRDVLGWTAGIDLKATDLTAYVAPAGTPPGSLTVLSSAAKLLREHPENYGVVQPWVNNDPRHAYPVNKPIDDLKGAWKCNLFGGNVLYAAGFEPPYLNNKRGDYPNANQFYKWSDKYAPQFGNQVRFKMVGEIDCTTADPATMNARIIDVLRSAQPGDLLMVKHQGGELRNGGHTRVVMANNLQADGSGTIASAQATWADAAIRDEQLSSFTSEDAIWILRPNKPRAGQPGATGQPYTVVPGDTFSKIAKAKLGSAARAAEIQALNPGVDPTKLRIGMKLTMPA